MTSTFTPNTTLSPETNPKDVGYLLGKCRPDDDRGGGDSEDHDDERNLCLRQLY